MEQDKGDGVSALLAGVVATFGIITSVMTFMDGDYAWGVGWLIFAAFFAIEAVSNHPKPTDKK